MSKVSFRARALDVAKPMPIYRSEEIPDMLDYDKINRAVVQMPTGMEKEEETETHLQKALTAQQFYGSAEARAIPIPEVNSLDDRYDKLYTPDFKLSKQYIHIQALGMEQEIPDYDLDSEDESWLQEQTKKLEMSSLKFEEMMDRLEKGSGQQVVTLPEAKLLLKEDDDLIIAVYDYWLNKRLRLEMPLIAHVKSEKRDGTSTNNPYVAFRRRTEKMQTRKNRKNDEVSYERMLKLKRDMVKASRLTEFLKRREKSKKEILQLTIEVMEKRFQMQDFTGTMLAEAEAEQAKMPSFVPPYILNSHGHSVSAVNGDQVAPVRKKRQYKRRQKQLQKSQHSRENASNMAASLPTFTTDLDLLHHGLESSEDDFVSPVTSPAEHEEESDPDGLFAFKRRKMCNYYAPVMDRLGNAPLPDPKEGSKGGKRHRFSLTSLSNGRCIGYARRRIGRGGRVVLDRLCSPWDDALDQLDLMSDQSYCDRLGDYITYIRQQKIPYYRPQTPPSEDDDDTTKGRHSPSPTFLCSSPTVTTTQTTTNSLRPNSLPLHENTKTHNNSSSVHHHGNDEEIKTRKHSSSVRDLANDLCCSFSSQPSSQFKLYSSSAVIESTHLGQKDGTDFIESRTGGEHSCDIGRNDGSQSRVQDLNHSEIRTECLVHSENRTEGLDRSESRTEGVNCSENRTESKEDFSLKSHSNGSNNLPTISNSVSLSTTSLLSLTSSVPSSSSSLTSSSSVSSSTPSSLSSTSSVSSSTPSSSSSSSVSSFSTLSLSSMKPVAVLPSAFIIQSPHSLLSSSSSLLSSSTSSSSSPSQPSRSLHVHAGNGHAVLNGPVAISSFLSRGLATASTSSSSPSLPPPPPSSASSSSPSVITNTPPPSAFSLSILRPSPSPSPSPTPLAVRATSGLVGGKAVVSGSRVVVGEPASVFSKNSASPVSILKSSSEEANSVPVRLVTSDTAVTMDVS